MAVAAAKLVQVEPLALEDIIHEGPMVITPDLARRIIDERVYERQRSVSRPHVLLWAEILRRERFQANRQIWFAVLDGRLYLIDGQHRAHGVVEASIPALFQVMFLPVASLQELHEAYTLFDKPVLNRPRGVNDTLKALDIPTKHDLASSYAQHVYRAAILAHFRFDPPLFRVDPVAVADEQERLSYAEPYWEAGATFQRLIKGAPATIRRRLWGTQVLAVALLTIRHQPDLAETFWKGLADNDGLRKGDPRHTFLDWLNANVVFDMKTYIGAMAASLAWNAHFERRTIASIRIGATKHIRIAGTPVRGERV